MEGYSGEDVWRSVPPEEKFELMAQAQAAGIMAAAMMILVCCTLAIGLKLPWLMWASFLASPFIFQFSAGKKWRDVKPRVMLEYLAARSAARRFAFAARGSDLGCKFLFRGRIEQDLKDSGMHAALEEVLLRNNQAEVWIALFGDSVVMMEERYGGAESRFTHLLDESITIDSHALDNRGDYSSNKEVIIKTTHKSRPAETYRVTSRYPAALVVFEKKIKSQILNPSEKEKKPALAVNDDLSLTQDGESSSGLLMFD